MILDQYKKHGKKNGKDEYTWLTFQQNFSSPRKLQLFLVRSSWIVRHQKENQEAAHIRKMHSWGDDAAFKQILDW